MAGLRVVFKNKNIGREYRAAVEGGQRRVRTSLLRTAREARDEILDQARDDIRSAGRFGAAWTQGLSAEIDEGDDGNIEIVFSHEIPFFTVFTKRTVIRGKPLLWIPLGKKYGGTAQGILARKFRGGLFRVDRPGKAPLLLSRKTGNPEYFGKRSVTIPKKFAIFEIMRDVAGQMKAMYKKHFSGKG